MNELISLNQSAINGELQQTVNARELHAFLEVGKDFSTWIKNRLETLGSIENEDYVVVENLSSPNSGNAKARPQTLKEYYLTLDVAKHLAMMEKNEKGLQIRKYFIECERKLREVSLHPTEQLLVNVLRANNDLDRTLAIKDYSDNYVKPLELKVEQQEAEIKELKPKGEFYDAVAQSNSTLSLDQVAKLLNFENMGRNNLCKYLRDKNIFNHKNVPYQKYIDAGYFKLTESSWRNPYTEELQVSIKTVMYQKGIDWLDRKLRTEGYKRNERPQDFL